MINCLLRTTDEGGGEVNPITHKTGNRRELRTSGKRSCFHWEGFGGKKAVMNSTVCESFLNWSGKVGVRTLGESLACVVVDFLGTEGHHKEIFLHSCWSPKEDSDMGCGDAVISWRIQRGRRVEWRLACISMEGKYGSMRITGVFSTNAGGQNAEFYRTKSWGGHWYKILHWFWTISGGTVVYSVGNSH